MGSIDVMFNSPSFAGLAGKFQNADGSTVKSPEELTLAMKKMIKDFNEGVITADNEILVANRKALQAFKDAPENAGNINLQNNIDQYLYGLGSVQEANDTAAKLDDTRDQISTMSASIQEILAKMKGYMGNK